MTGKHRLYLQRPAQYVRLSPCMPMAHVTIASSGVDILTAHLCHGIEMQVVVACIVVTCKHNDKVCTMQLTEICFSSFTYWIRSFSGYEELHDTCVIWSQTLLQRSAVGNLRCTGLSDVTEAAERAHVMPCLHAFCFSCIKRWAQLRRECPLCKVRRVR